MDAIPLLPDFLDLLKFLNEPIETAMFGMRLDYDDAARTH
jgi:hypothetical protein